MYVKKDPFSDKNNLIILGSICSLCNKHICHNTVSNAFIFNKLFPLDHYRIAVYILRKDFVANV